jgi:transposase-like protein
VSFTPFGEDPLADAIRRRVRDIIEHTVEEELDAALGAGSYARVTERRGYRHGHQERRLGTTVGPVGLTLPRARLFAAAGGTQEWHPQAVRRYRRRMVAVDNAVIGTFLAGVNQRRLRGALRPLLRDVPLSKSAVSRLVTRLRTGWEEWRTRALAEERCVYLYLDGFGVKVRCGGRVVRMTVLAAVGVRPDGQKCLLALDLAASESAEAWRGLLEGLVARGLRPPMLCIVDGSPGLGQALGAVWRDVAVQRCMVHKLRNLLAKAPQHAHDALRDDFHAIMYAESAAAAEAAYQRFVARWAKRCQRVVESLEEAGAELLTVFRLTPAAQWKCLRSTNVIERMHEEFRRRIKTQASLPTEDAVLVLLFALMASGQLRLRRIDGWRELGAVMDRVLRPAA